MIAAVVDLATGIVVNTIVVDSIDDPAPDGTKIIEVPHGVSIGPYQATWKDSGGFSIVDVAVKPAVKPIVIGNMT